MIIGETFNENNYYGYEEENYDYLFKRKSKEERQQRKAENKQKRSEKKQVRQQKRQEKKGDSAQKKTILGNFGLFNRNKKKEKEKEKAVTTGSTPSSSSSGKMGNVLDALQEKATGINLPGNESTGSEAEAANLESKELDQNAKPKEAGFGPMLGFAFLGITILLAGFAIYKADKKPISQLQPMKVAA